jgi:hypothetical protein
MLAQAGGELAGWLRADGCKSFLDEARKRGGLLLGRIEGVSVDGRDSRARLVKAVLRTEGKDKAVVLRVEAVEGRWRLVSL